MMECFRNKQLWFQEFHKIKLKCYVRVFSTNGQITHEQRQMVTWAHKLLFSWAECC